MQQQSMCPTDGIRCLSSTSSLSSSLIFHRQELLAKSFNKCSGFYDDYECSTQYCINSLKKLLFRVLHISVGVIQWLSWLKNEGGVCVCVVGDWEAFPSKVSTKRWICVHQRFGLRNDSSLTVK